MMTGGELLELLFHQNRWSFDYSCLFLENQLGMAQSRLYTSDFAYPALIRAVTQVIR